MSKTEGLFYCLNEPRSGCDGLAILSRYSWFAVRKLLIPDLPLSVRLRSNVAFRGPGPRCTYRLRTPGTYGISRKAP